MTRGVSQAAARGAGGWPCGAGQTPADLSLSPLSSLILACLLISGRPMTYDWLYGQFTIVVLARRRLISVPTGFRPRLSGHSKVNNLRTIWSNFKQMLTLRQYL